MHVHFWLVVIIIRIALAAAKVILYIVTCLYEEKVHKD